MFHCNSFNSTTFYKRLNSILYLWHFRISALEVVRLIDIRTHIQKKIHNQMNVTKRCVEYIIILKVLFVTYNVTSTLNKQ